MNCLRSLERWYRGFESHSRHGCLYCVRLFCVCVVLCVGRGLETGWSRVHGVLATVYRIKKLKKRPRPNKGPTARYPNFKWELPQVPFTERFEALSTSVMFQNIIQDELNALIMLFAFNLVSFIYILRHIHHPVNSDSCLNSIFVNLIIIGHFTSKLYFRFIFRCFTCT
jgi:hypothetical protein